MTIKIRSMVTRNEEPNEVGSRLVAMFDADVRGMRFSGCPLFQRLDESYIAYLPRARGKSSNDIRIVDPALQTEFSRRAAVALHALTGECEIIAAG